MTVHLSARLTWHDAGLERAGVSRSHWRMPPASCTSTSATRVTTTPRLAHAGQALDEIAFRPPCSRDPGAYSDTGYVTTHRDPLDFRKLPSVD